MCPCRFQNYRRFFTTPQRIFLCEIQRRALFSHATATPKGLSQKVVERPKSKAELWKQRRKWQERKARARLESGDSKNSSCNGGGGFVNSCKSHRVLVQGETIFAHHRLRLFLEKYQADHPSTEKTSAFWVRDIPNGMFVHKGRKGVVVPGHIFNCASLSAPADDEVVLYNWLDLGRKLLHRPATGAAFADQHLFQLAAEQRGFKSNHWFTAEENLHWKLRPGSAGVEISIPHKAVYYNRECFDLVENAHREASTGNYFEEPDQQVLNEAATKRKFLRVFWSDMEHASSINLELAPTEEDTEGVLLSNGKRYFNLQQFRIVHRIGKETVSAEVEKVLQKALLGQKQKNRSAKSAQWYKPGELPKGFQLKPTATGVMVPRIGYVYNQSQLEKQQ